MREGNGKGASGMGPGRRAPVKVRTSGNRRRPPEPDRGYGNIHLGLLFLLGLLLALLVGCGGSEGGEAGSSGGSLARDEAPVLGPRDGRDLPATDLERVAVGNPAPDFSLVSLTGDTVTLSSYRGLKNVVLVFYRGHW